MSASRAIAFRRAAGGTSKAWKVDGQSSDSFISVGNNPKINIKIMDPEMPF
jgi:hypothetical protein